MKNSIAIIFTFIFTLFIVSPAILSVVEENFDISILLNVGEEENNQKEISKNFDLKIPETKNYTFLFNSLEKKNLFDNLLKKYTNISLEYSSPPPKFM